MNIFSKTLKWLYIGRHCMSINKNNKIVAFFLKLRFRNSARYIGNENLRKYQNSGWTCQTSCMCVDRISLIAKEKKSGMNCTVSGFDLDYKPRTTRKLLQSIKRSSYQRRRQVRTTQNKSALVSYIDLIHLKSVSYRRLKFSSRRLCMAIKTKCLVPFIRLVNKITWMLCGVSFVMLAWTILFPLFLRRWKLNIGTTKKKYPNLLSNFLSTIELRLRKVQIFCDFWSLKNSVWRFFFLYQRIHALNSRFMLLRPLNTTTKIPCGFFIFTQVLNSQGKWKDNCSD